MWPFKKSKPPEPEEIDDILWLKGFSMDHPDAWLCLESRPLGETKLISAAVLFDSDTKTASIFTNVDLGWMGGLRLRDIQPHPIYSAERPRLPIVVIHKDQCYNFEHESAVQIRLISENRATYVAFPWHVSEFMHLWSGIERWVFWSFWNERRKSPSHYFGFGNFSSIKEFENYVTKI